MNNPTLMWHVTMAVHADRVRDRQRFRRLGMSLPRGSVRHTLARCVRLVARLHVMPARV